ncbi:MAG: ATP-binding cassette domain-containing protein [Taibaiella sp.]|nr:ATP-binding cassette domain-containing protein [Taibaiella sp.]
MNINIHQLYKKFNLTWVIRDFSCTFVKDKIYALTGHNGSGKSTLINIIAGLQQASRGKIEWVFDDKDIKKENIFRHISLCSPSMELIEEMTLSELLHFHFAFKKIHTSESGNGYHTFTGITAAERSKNFGIFQWYETKGETRPGFLF